MAAVKLNVFHWHLSDDQGFRVESRRYPQLQGMGSDGNFYTQDQVREVIAYARDRGIRVVPEFDVPGHATAWLVGMPELGPAAGTISDRVQAGASLIHPGSEQRGWFINSWMDSSARWPRYSPTPISTSAATRFRETVDCQPHRAGLQARAQSEQ